MSENGQTAAGQQQAAAEVAWLADSLTRAVRDWHGPGGATQHGLAGLGQLFRQALTEAARPGQELRARVLALADELDEESTVLMGAVKGEAADSLARKYVNGRVTSLQDSAQRIRAAVGAPATAEGDDRG